MTFVYLIISEKRLVITQNRINSENYHILINTDGPNSLQICKTFCIGYLMGNIIAKDTNYTILNDVKEFS